MSKQVETSWPLWKDQVVILALGGATHKAIAEHMTSIGHEMTRQNVSHILKDPRAEEMVRIARAKFRETLMEDIHDELDVASKLALKSVKRTLKAEINPMDKAKANQDRVALKVLSGRGFLREDSRQAEQGLVVPPEQFSKLVAAMEKSDRAKEVEVTSSHIIVDAEFEVEEGEVKDDGS